MNLYKKLPFQPGSELDKGMDPKLRATLNRWWEEIAKIVNFNATRTLLVGTSAERAGLPSSQLLTDQIWYQIDDGQLWRWDGSAWVQP